MSTIAPLQYQAGGESLVGSRDPKLGILSWKLKCWAPDRGSAVNGPLPEDFSPLVEWQPRTITRLTAGEDAGYHVVVTVEGHATPDAADGEDFGFEGTMAEDAIESHPNYLAILKQYNGNEDKQGRAQFPKELDINGDKIRNRMHGVESYRNPGLIWTHKWVTPRLDDTLIRALGTIDRPPFGPGGPIRLDGNRNWLKIRAGGLYRGNIWQINESWEVSGPYGWTPEIYARRLL